MKKVYLLDTNIISEFVKLNPDSKVLELYQARRDLSAISAITWQELTRGLERMSEGKRKNTITNFIQHLSENIQIIPYDKFAAEICGKIQTIAEKNGKTISYYDSQIAATAISCGMILVTRNTSDFQEIKERAFLQLENWFSS